MKYARIICLICLIIAIVGIIIFICGATTGTISGYRGADGQYYSDIGARGSNEWMCTPGLIVAVIGFIGFAITKKVDTPTKSNNTLQNVEDKANSTNGIIGEKTRMDRVTATNAGTVLDFHVNVGDIIKTGTKICTIESFGTAKDVYSKAGGEVLSIDVSIGSNVSYGDTLAHILYKE